MAGGRWRRCQGDLLSLPTDQVISGIETYPVTATPQKSTLQDLIDELAQMDDDELTLFAEVAGSSSMEAAIALAAVLGAINR